MRIVVKIGTSLITDTKHQLARSFLQQLVSDIAVLYKAGHDIVIVSSGAVASGRGELTLSKEKKSIPFRQVLAAVGQGLLMETYRACFKKHSVVVAQGLLTNYDFINRENFLNTKNVVQLLIGHRVIPIINENDVTTVAELKFGDNDMLSAKTAAMISADLLCILTDVEGLFDSNPRTNPNAKIIPFVQHVGDSIKAAAGDATSSASKGGMVTKLEAAAYATSVGIATFIGSGRRKGILLDVVSWLARYHAKKEVVQSFPYGTFFHSSVTKVEGQKKWLKPKLKKNAWIEVDSGAVSALCGGGKSLLPSGIVDVAGAFSRGDVVMVKGPRSLNEGVSDIGYGEVNYASIDIDKIKKHRSNEIEDLLGYAFEEEVIHRDRMVLLK